MNRQEIEKLQAFFRKRFNLPSMSVKPRAQKADSAEVYIGDEFIGVLFRAAVLWCGRIQIERVKVGPCERGERLARKPCFRLNGHPLEQQGHQRGISEGSRRTSKSTAPHRLIVPLNTCAPTSFSTGIASPVIADSSLALRPLDTIPSAENASPGFTRTTPLLAAAACPDW